jgi:hypothetical protein
VQQAETEIQKQTQKIYFKDEKRGAMIMHSSCNCCGSSQARATHMRTIVLVTARLYAVVQVTAVRTLLIAVGVKAMDTCRKAVDVSAHMLPSRALLRSSYCHVHTTSVSA